MTHLIALSIFSAGASAALSLVAAFNNRDDTCSQRPLRSSAEQENLPGQRSTQHYLCLTAAMFAIGCVVLILVQIATGRL